MVWAHTVKEKIGLKNFAFSSSSVVFAVVQSTFSFFFSNLLFYAADDCRSYTAGKQKEIVGIFFPAKSKQTKKGAIRHFTHFLSREGALPRTGIGTNVKHGLTRIPGQKNAENFKSRNRGKLVEAVSFSFFFSQLFFDR